MLELYGIKGCNLGCFESYLSNRKQFITYGDKQTNIETITCGVPQGSILGPLKDPKKSKNFDFKKSKKRSKIVPNFC